MKMSKELMEFILEVNEISRKLEVMEKLEAEVERISEEVKEEVERAFVKKTEPAKGYIALFNFKPSAPRVTQYRKRRIHGLWADAENSTMANFERDPFADGIT